MQLVVHNPFCCTGQRPPEASSSSVSSLCFLSFKIFTFDEQQESGLRRTRMLRSPCGRPMASISSRWNLRMTSGSQRKHAVKAVATPGPVVGLPLTAENVDSVLDEVRPYLIADGGNVALHEIDGNVVKLKLQGACGSCPSSVMTMKMGIERRLMEKIPEIVAVEPIADEVAGLELNEENIEKVLDELRPYLVGTGGGELELVSIEEPIVKVRLSGPAAGVMTVRVALTQKLREKIPAIAAVHLLRSLQKTRTATPFISLSLSLSLLVASFAINERISPSALPTIFPPQLPPVLLLLLLLEIVDSRVPRFSARIGMDLSRSQSSLSLSCHGHRSAIPDDSISLQTDASLRDDPRPVPLQLLDQQSENRRDGSVGLDQDEDSEDGGKEDFSCLGHTMSLKRPRRGDSFSSCSSSSSLHPSKRAAVGPSLESRMAAVRSWGNQALPLADPDLHGIMEKERQRQIRGIELIASENYVCRGVLDALGSHLTNKYSEGMPGARYYGGNQYIDQIERLCCDRALAAFDLDPECWGVNVQPYSCSSANFAVYTGLLLPKDRIMGLDSLSGGHVSHGYLTPGGKRISGASIFFESLSYKVNPHTGYIDYDKVEERAMDFHPKILICGGSSYPREWDYAKFRQIADKCGAILMCDMAQISGLVAAKECPSPFDHCDVVTSTTHKSLRGPRGGMIFFRKGRRLKKRGFALCQTDEKDQCDFEDKINFAVFPSMQGGPHNNHIAALAIALKQAASPEYKAYIQQVKRNAQALARALLRKKCRLVTGGSDNHLLLWDLRTFGITGKCKTFEKVCEACRISLNKTPIYGENGAICSAGVRIGDFEKIAEFLVRAAHIASNLQREHGKMRKEFLNCLQNNREIMELSNQVDAFSMQFAMPGFDS
ncbi:Serine hydroxymethyltransferase 6 [Apostasia shenzhenica]|uniref:Serine hydroxymethyltransferase n=1 Tax=Apostasia shenzhenica TaxID=1088818 RepID=A0A2I0AP99_9ASPA|nr:Serine hydroxymethyltransferase 6 [Apostasia shenzhenica]